MTALSNIHAPPSTPQQLTQYPRRADRWTARAGAEGWVGDIDSMSTVLGERGGQRRFSYKANSGPISSHILSGDLCIFFFYLLPPFFASHSLRRILSLFHFYSVKAKKKEKETRSTKVVLPAVNSGRRGVQIALQKTGLRAEISHNAADKKVGHITFGGHVTRM